MVDSEIRLSKEDFRNAMKHPDLESINQRDNFVSGILSYTDDCGTLLIDTVSQKGKYYGYVKGEAHERL